MKFRHLLSLLTLAAAFGLASHAEAQISTTETFKFTVGSPPTTSYWSGGHGDIDIHQKQSGEWEIHYHFHDEDGERATGGGSPAFPGSPFQAEWEAGDLTMVINPTLSQRTRAAGNQWNFTGVNAGQLFYVLPASEAAGLPFLGFSAEGKPFDITFSLGSVTGGAISAWTEDGLGQPTPYWSSTAPGANGGFTVEAGAHEHMFIGFSQLGDYTAAITAVPEPASLGVLAAAGLGLAAFAAHRRRRR